MLYYFIINFFQCDICNQDPIIGIRWHCTECPTITSTDFCNDCVKKEHSSKTHTPMHVLKQIQQMSKKDTLKWLQETMQ